MGPMISSLAAFIVFFGTLFFAPLLAAQNNWFQPGMVKQPAVAKALQSIDDRSSIIVDEWIRLVEIPAPSRKEQARAEYIRAEMQSLGLADIRMESLRPKRPPRRRVSAFAWKKTNLAITPTRFRRANA